MGGGTQWVVGAGGLIGQRWVERLVGARDTWGWHAVGGQDVHTDRGEASSASSWSARHAVDCQGVRVDLCSR